MPNLVRRVHYATPATTQKHQYDEKKNFSRRGAPKLGLLAASIGALLVLIVLVPIPVSFLKPQLLSQVGFAGMSLEVAPGVRLVVDMKPVKAGDSKAEPAVSLGTHTATLLFERSCDNPRFWLRAEGDALVAVNLLVPSKLNADTSWRGTFEFPIEGKYDLVGYWHGCGQDTNRERIHMKSITARGAHASYANTTNSIFPASAWISSKKFKQIDPGTTTQPYIWHNPNVSPESATLLKTGNTILSKEGTVEGAGFFAFNSLSNYELVCWVGSDSANLLRKTFLEARSLLFKHQRPFKFHMYPIEYFEKPDRDWEESTKARLRKCKHILVSVDEVKQSMSQSEYINQVQTFINHLLKVIADETFPIWMFTVFESPLEASNCLPRSLPGTSEHPCNDALKSLFQDSPFPKRVQLLDATELSLPQLGDNKRDLVAAVALRIYVFVGKQVQKWRFDGQTGTVSGLERGGKTEPNFELVPYTGWS